MAQPDHLTIPGSGKGGRLWLTVQVAGRRDCPCRRFRVLQLEEGGMEPGWAETTDVCYVGIAVLAHFTNVETEA